MVSQTIKITVIGAGYAGLLATMRLAMKNRGQDVRITLVNPSEFFVERPRLHQFAANQPVSRRPIREVLQGSGVQFIQAAVTAIDLRRREIVLQAGAGEQRLAYDYLLYAAGSAIQLEGVPGVRAFAYSLSPAGLRSAEALKTALPEVGRREGRLVVVGGGPTGIESAAEFAESFPGLAVTLVTQGQLGALWGGEIQRHIHKTLERLGVSIRERTSVVRVEHDAVFTALGERIDFDLCLWAGGFVASPLAKETGLAVNARGQVVTDLFMRSISDPRVYAAGDSAQPSASSGVTVRMAAYTAAITGAHAADCLDNAIHGRPQKPLNFAYLGQAIALGRREAVGFNNFPDDQPKWPVFTGRLAILGREFFVNLLRDLPGIERRLPGWHFWPGRGKAKLNVDIKFHGEKTESAR